LALPRVRQAKALRVRSLLTIESRRYVVYVAFLLIFVFFAVTLRDDGFLAQANLLNIVRQTTPVTVMAVAVVFVLSAGEIDLSLGAVVALSALVTADVMQSRSSVLAVAAGLGVGVGIGAVNGIFVTLLRLPSFLVTLASMGLVAGLARMITNLESVAVENQSFINIFGSGNVGPIPSLAFWALGAVALGQFVFRHKRFGAHVVATGDNVGAARAAGIRVDRVRFAVLVLSGTSAAVAGILYTGRLQGASYTLGEQDLLTVIAAVVIGGTRLFGGAGSVIGAVAGSLIMGMLTNGLILWGLSSSEQMISQGALLLLAISLTLRAPKRE
jgi:ribose transport system permease protein